MRECWINVYPRIDVNNGHYLGMACNTPDDADRSACGFFSATAADLRHAGVGYRLHVRLKVPALPATDALAAVKAGEDENGRAA